MSTPQDRVILIFAKGVLEEPLDSCDVGLMEAIRTFNLENVCELYESLEKPVPKLIQALARIEEEIKRQSKLPYSTSKLKQLYRNLNADSSGKFFTLNCQTSATEPEIIEFFAALDTACKECGFFGWSLDFDNQEFPKVYYSTISSSFLRRSLMCETLENLATHAALTKSSINGGLTDIIEAIVSGVAKRRKEQFKQWEQKAKEEEQKAKEEKVKEEVETIK